MAVDLERLDQLLSEQEAEIRASFIRYVQLVQSPAVMALVEERLAQRDIQGAFQILESYIVQMGDVLPRVQHSVGVETARELNDTLRSAALAISFDATDPFAAQAVRTQRLALIREFTDSQFASVDQAVRRAMLEGVGAQGLARAFRDAIGLTANQESYVATYRGLLETNPRASLDRALRDRRYDDRVRTAIERDRKLTARQIETMVTRYRARALAARSEGIARTEALRATSEAREEALRQMMALTGLSRDRIERVWNATKDKRTRDHHRSMNKQVRAVGEPFEDGLGNSLRYPGDPTAPAETVINCRCSVTFRVLPPA